MVRTPDVPVRRNHKDGTSAGSPKFECFARFRMVRAI